MHKLHYIFNAISTIVAATFCNYAGQIEMHYCIQFHCNILAASLPSIFFIAYYRNKNKNVFVH